jgi:SAM-dependent methyltransferase
VGSLLEVGCGAGAVLGVIGRTFPQTILTGVDIEPRQLRRARVHLQQLEVSAALVAADASALPLRDHAFDFVLFMWMLEHLQTHDAVLAEALRVLRPGGTETDYNFVTYPQNDEFDRMMVAWRAEFARHGDVLLARRLGPKLLKAGFVDVGVSFAGFHEFRRPGDEDLTRMANYHADYIEPELPRIAESQGVPLASLRRGIEWLRGLGMQDEASISGTVYRATARRAPED